MRKSNTLDFFDISSDLEVLPENELFKIKGGDSDIAWENEIDEVVISGDSDDDPWGDDGNEDPDPWNEYPEDDYYDDSDGDWNDYDRSDPNPNPEKEEEDKECTCEKSVPKKFGQDTGLKDPNNIISNLGADITNNMKYLIDHGNTLISDNTISQQGYNRMLSTYNTVINIMSAIDNSGYNFRIEYADLETSNNQASGGLYKESDGNYVIAIDASNLPSSGVNGLIIHELYHAYQVINGQIGFDNSGNPTMIGMEDEIAAYQLQYNFDAGAAGTPKTATEAGLKADYPNIYDNLPSQGGKCAVHG